MAKNKSRSILEARGTFPSQAIDALVRGKCIASDTTIGAGQIQPSSFDLTLSEEAYQLPGSFLPLPGESVDGIVQQYSKAYRRKPLDLSTPTLLDRGKVYLIRLRESFKLPTGVAAYTNNKSSTGRIDLATRVICDGNPRYDKIPAGYAGRLWLEVTPKSFDVVVEAGVSLNQAIFYRDRTILRTGELQKIYTPDPLLTIRKAARFRLTVSWWRMGF